MNNNKMLAEAYLRQHLSKPWDDLALYKFDKLMESLSEKEQQEIINDKTIKKLIERVNM